MLHPTKARALAGGLGFQKSQARPSTGPSFWPQARAGTSLTSTHHHDILFIMLNCLEHEHDE